MSAAPTCGWCAISVCQILCKHTVQGEPVSNFPSVRSPVTSEHPSKHLNPGILAFTGISLGIIGPLVGYFVTGLSRLTLDNWRYFAGGRVLCQLGGALVCAIAVVVWVKQMGTYPAVPSISDLLRPLAKALLIATLVGLLF